MKTFLHMTKRNIKLFLKDKGLFFVSLITPCILLLLFVTFLGNVYRSTFTSIIPKEAGVPDKLINGLVGGQLISSLLAVSCITVAFCSNMVMVQDKISGAFKDICITPVKKSTLSMSYFVATMISSLCICLVAFAISLVYLAFTGWYLTASDVVFIIFDIIVLVTFGTALSSIVNFFLSTQGQCSAVGSLVSSVYGFICGAYMPISNFPVFLQSLLSFLPGTYGTVLLRNHCMGNAINELASYGVPDQFINELKDGIDCNMYFFDNSVPLYMMLTVILAATVLLILAYILINVFVKRKKQ